MQINRLDELLKNTVALFPDKRALMCPAEGDVTYRELFSRAQMISAYLGEAAIVKNERVGVYLPKTSVSVASIFAVLMSDGCYVPADISAPAARCAYIFTDCNVRLILAQSDAVSSLLASLATQNVFPMKIIDIPIGTTNEPGLQLVILETVVPEYEEVGS